MINAHGLKAIYIYTCPCVTSKIQVILVKNIIRSVKTYVKAMLMLALLLNLGSV